MATIEWRRGSLYDLSVSVTLGDFDTQLAGIQLESGRRTVPNPQFPSFSLQSAFLHYNNTQDPMFRVFLRNLFLIATSEDVDAADRPTEYAISTVLELIWGARGLAGVRGWSNPEVDITGNGGVRLSWRRNTRMLVAVFPPNHNYHRYLYYEDADICRAIPDHESATLAERLVWLNTPHATAL